MNLKIIFLIISVLTLYFLSTAQSSAHHSMAEFDHENPIELTGDVIEWQFINPHSWLILYANNDKGELVEWALESTSPSVLRNRGYSRSTFKEGDKVIVRISPRRDGNPEGGMGAILSINGLPFFENTNK